MFSCSHFQSNLKRQNHVEEASGRKNLEKRNMWWQNRSRRWVWYRRASGVSYSQENYGMQSPNSDRSGITSSQVWHQYENTRTGIGKPIAQIQNRLTETRLTHHNFEIFNVPHLKKVFADVRQKLSRQEGDQMQDLEVSWIIWRMCVCRGRRRQRFISGWIARTNLFITKNTDFEQLKTLFDISQSLILGHKSEIDGISAIEWHLTPWRRSTLLHDRAINLSKTRVHVYADSALCLGKMHEHLAAMDRWKEQFGWFLGATDQQELHGIDGEPFEFEWNVFPGHAAVELLCEIQLRMDNTRNQTRGIRRSDHLHVDVQWCRLDKRWKT